MGSRPVLGDDHAFASCQPVILDDVRRAAPVQRIIDLRHRGDADGRSCRHPGRSHYILGEGLGTLDAGRRRTWPEDREATGPQLVGGAIDQRDFRTDDNQVGLDDVREVGDSHRIGGVDRMRGRQRPGPCVARGDVQVTHGRVAPERTQQSVFTGTRADDENAHVGQSIRRGRPFAYPRSENAAARSPRDQHTGRCAE